MIPHLGPNPKLPRPVMTAADYMTLVLRAMGVPPIGFRPKPDLGEYEACDPIEPRPRKVWFDVPRRERGGKRVDPAAERHRLRAA